jgi:predicted amidohydrolase YtcJ
MTAARSCRNAIAAGLISGTGDDMLMVGAVKLFLDGSAGGRTAWMSEPYLGEDKTTGVFRCLDRCRARALTSWMPM